MSRFPSAANSGATPIPVRSWYGLRGEIAVENELWHLVKVAGVSLNHPPVVNWIMRRDPPPEDRLRLSFFHEYGHLQTFPLALAHLAWLLFMGRWRGLGAKGLLARLAAAAVAHEAVWELASETYAILGAGPEYRRAYRAHPNPLRPLFWAVMVTLAILGSILTLRPRDDAS